MFCVHLRWFLYKYFLKFLNPNFLCLWNVSPTQECLPFANYIKQFAPKSDQVVAISKNLHLVN